MQKSEITDIGCLLSEVKVDLRKQLDARTDKLGSENVSPSEVFDSKYRPELWNTVIDRYEKLPSVDKQKALKEIVFTDVKLFRDMLKANHQTFKEAQAQKSDRLVASFEGKLAKTIKASDEYRENESLNFELMDQLENILNYFYLIEFYVFPNLKHKKYQPTKGYWSFSLMVNGLMYKSLGLLIQSLGTLIEGAFSNATLTKNLLSIAMVAYVGFHPAMMVSLKGTHMYAVLCPLLAKFLRWSGLFSYLSNMMTMRDTLMYITAMNKSLQDTVKILADLRNVISSELTKFLEGDDSEENEQAFFKNVQDLVEKFGCSFNNLQTYVENKTALGYVQKEDTDGWIVLEKAARNDLDNLKTSYHPGP